MSSLAQLTTQLERLTGFDAGPFPVVSLYLNLQPNEHGRSHFEPFLRKELTERLRTYAANGPERQSWEQDPGKMGEYMENIAPSASGLVLFSCSGGGLFEIVHPAAPIQEHRLYVSDQPHLYPLARLIDEYTRYAVVLADTHVARIFVIAGNAIERTQQIEGIKTRRHKIGGWSQARSQRHIDNYHLQHPKERADTLTRIFP